MQHFPSGKRQRNKHKHDGQTCYDRAAEHLIDAVVDDRVGSSRRRNRIFSRIRSKTTTLSVSE